MPPEKKATVLRVRTFADDIKRAEGGAPTHSPGEQSKSPSHSLADALEAHVGEVVERTKAPVTVPTDTSTTARTQSEFDIRRAESDGMEEGTIIQDRKEKEWSFFDAMKASTATWWATHIQTLFEDRRTHTKADIAPLARGPRTIVAPDAFTIAPRDDHGALLKNIRGNETSAAQKEMATPPQPPTQPPKPTPLASSGWRRISEPRDGTAIAHTSSEEARTYKEDLRRALPQKNSISPSLKSSAPLHAIRRTDLLAKNTVAVAPLIPEREATLARERLATLAREAAESTPEPKRVSRDIPFIAPKLIRTEAPPLRTYRNDALSDIKARDLSAPKIAAAEYTRRDELGTMMGLPHERPSILSRILPVFIVLTIVAVLSVGGFVLYPLLTKDAPVETIRGVPALFTTDTQKAFPLPQTRGELLATLNTLRLETPLKEGSFLQLYAEIKEGDTTRIANTSDIMKVLDPRAPGALLRSFKEESMIGTYDSARAPYFIFTTDAFTTAFAGMLAWEETMSVDLAPFFGGPVRRTYDDTALTIDQSKPARFTDIVVRNKDVRMLYDEFGEERIAYTFISGNMIVLTTSSRAIEAIVRALE